jgi:hypothetical protein
LREVCQAILQALGKERAGDSRCENVHAVTWPGIRERPGGLRAGLAGSGAARN